VRSRLSRRDPVATEDPQDAASQEVVPRRRVSRLSARAKVLVGVGVGVGVLLCAAVAFVVLFATVTRDGKLAKPAAPTPARTARFLVSPTGTGDCVVSACSSINAAVARAKATQTSGAVVQLAAGSYIAQTISDTKLSNTIAANIVVEPASGAIVSMPALTINAARVTVRDVTVTGPVRLESDATYSGVDSIVTQLGSVFMAASHSFLTNSAIRPDVDSDGIQIKAYGGQNPDGVTIEHDVVGPTHRGPKRAHVDCIQILGGSSISIRYDRLFHCADQGIIAGSGATGTISGSILVERNEIQLCPTRTDDCDGFDAISMVAPQVIFIHNTVIDGGTVFNVPDLTLAGNYIENLKTCAGTVESNLIGSTQCPDLPPSNQRGQLDFVDVTASPPNLTPTKAVVVASSGQWVGGAYSTVDIDGHSVDPSSATIGAVQFGSH
jgi:hypothetical protein